MGLLTASIFLGESFSQPPKLPFTENEATVFWQLFKVELGNEKLFFFFFKQFTDLCYITLQDLTQAKHTRPYEPLLSAFFVNLSYTTGTITEYTTIL